MKTLTQAKTLRAGKSLLAFAPQLGPKDTEDARCWGGNDHGQLGDGTTPRAPCRAAVTVLASTVRPCQRRPTCALVAGWGDKVLGLLGTGTFSLSLVPVEVDFSQAP